MYHGYRKIFWGLFFATFYLNIQSIRILPEVIAYVILLIGVSGIADACPTKTWRYAKIAAGLYTLFSLIGSILPFTEVEMSRYSVTYLLLFSVCAAIRLIMVYFILMGSVEWLRSIGLDELARNFEKKLCIYIIWMIICTVGLIAVMVLMEEIISIVVIIVALVLQIWLMKMISSLKETADAMMTPLQNENVLLENNYSEL